MQALLNTGSTINEGRLAKGGNKYSEDYTKECAVCWMCAEDFTSLGCPDKVSVTSRDGKHTVAVRPKVTEAMRSGQVFIPRSIWANVVVEPDTFSTGSPRYKGAPVFVEPTDEEVLGAEEIVLKLYMGGE